MLTLIGYSTAVQLDLLPIALMQSKLSTPALRCIVATLLLEVALSFLSPRVRVPPKRAGEIRAVGQQPSSHSLKGSYAAHVAGTLAQLPVSGARCQTQWQRSRGFFRVTLLSVSASEGTVGSTMQHEEESAQSPPTTTAAAGTAAGTATHHNEDFLFKQKLESVKAAVLCGGVGAVARLLAVGAGAVAPALVRDALGAPDAAASSVLFGLASGFAQGALFGLTYRYVVRSDRDTQGSSSSSSNKKPAPQMDGFTVSHLGDGCVAAFALTSALGQSEASLSLAAGEFSNAFGRGAGLLEALAAVLLPALPFLPRAAGDLLLYSAARAAIDRALDEGAIKPFP